MHLTIMADQILLAAGSWWRFSDYQIENGKIRPVSGAELAAFDPWEEYYASLGRLVCRSECVTEAEIHYVLEHEWAQDLTMVARRTRCGVGSCQGMDCAHRAAHIVREYRGRTSEPEAREMAEDFLAWRLKEHASVLTGTSLAQFEFSHALHR